MGLIYNNNVEETKILTAYGLTVYGKVNRYDWTVFNKESENAMISIRISEESGKDLVKMNLGNNCIFQNNIESTMDNFLYWIAAEKPDTYIIEDMVYRCLCSSDSLFNHRIAGMKEKARREEELRICFEKQKRERESQLAELESYCKENGYFYFIDFADNVTIIKATTDSVRHTIATTQKNNDREKMESYINFARKYPDNNELKIVNYGVIEELIRSIQTNRRE